ncbi:MAG: hypothetical protein ABIR51_02420 [Sphingomicrobium sp.]
MTRAFLFAALFAAPACLTAPASAQLAAVAAFESARSVPLAPGGWAYVASSVASESTFAVALRIRCDRAARQVTIQRLGVAPVPGVALQPMLIATDSMARVLPGAAASLGARDPLLDAIAFSRGRFVVTGGGGGMLVLPAWPEAARSIEDCRN